MGKNSVIGLMYMLQGLQSDGIDVTALLARQGLSQATLDPTADINLSTEIELFRDLLQQYPDPLVGLKIGDAIPWSSYGVLTMLISTCKNGYEAFRMGVKYQALTFLHSHMSIELEAQNTLLLLRPEPMPEDVRRLFIDSDIVGTVKLIRDIQGQLGVQGHPNEIWFPYPKPPEYRTYEQHFGCTVKFDQAVGGIRVPNAFLNFPFVTANSMANEAYQRQCDELLRQRKPLAGVSGRVTAYLEMFVGKFPCVSEVAGSLGLSERTLRRQLTQEHTSFQKLLDEARLQKAQRYLQENRLTIETIASELGYSESAAFIHAFRRWTGQTPQQYRQAMV